ncbi:MAG TPA: hypothetical protein VM430_08760 [Microbacterium sp.]|jgi:hypothetical protein|nr:hypothetical protein [Microbacterium sp.]
MAGTFAYLRFRPTAADPRSIVERLRTFTKGRLSERAVAQLEWPEVEGASAEEWELAGCRPSTFDLTPNDCSDDVLRRTRTATLTSREAIGHFRLDPWHGLFIDLEIPPGPEDYPDISGSCQWYVWLAGGAWQQAVAIEFPTSSVGRDPRWHSWLRGWIDDAMSVFDTACVLRTTNLFSAWEESDSA